MKKTVSLAVIFFVLFFVSGCSNNTLIETTKNDLRDFSGAANPTGYLESKKDGFNAWKKTAGKGVPEGQVLYGLCYAYGINVRENKPEAVKWFRKAAEQELAEGQYQLGRCYWSGEGVPEDKAEGVKWLYKAKEQGHGEADALFQIAKRNTGVNIVPVVYRATEEEQGGAVALPPIATNGTDAPSIELKGPKDLVISAAFSHDGTKVVTASGNTARIRDAKTGGLLRTLEGHTSDVWSAAFSPDGKKIVTASEDKTARIWDAETGKELQRLEGHTSSLSRAAFSPDGKRIVTVGGLILGPGSVVASQDDTTRIWDAETGKELHQFLRHSRGSDVAVFSPDGKKIITVSSPSRDNTIRIWDVESGKEVQTLTGYSPFPDFAFSPDGTKVVVASGNKNAQIWNAETGRMLRTLSGHMGGVNVASFSPDGKKVVTGCEEGTVRIWDAESGNEIRQLLALPRVLSPSKTGGDPQNIQFVAFSPDGKRIVATSGPTAHVLDAVTGRELQKLETTFHVVPVFSPDGKKIVTVSNDDNTARIWNLP